MRHLLTHTGGTGDIFGPEFTTNRLTLREHGDYLACTARVRSATNRARNIDIRTTASFCSARSSRSDRPVVLRSRPERGLPACRHECDRFTSRVRERPCAFDRVSERDGAWVANTDTLPGGAPRRARLLDRRRFLPIRRSARIGKAHLESAARRGHRPQEQRYGYGFGAQGEGPLRMYGMAAARRG